MVVSLSIAFFAGFISFISPCVLPLIPGYISFICGTTLNELDNKSKNFILKKSIFFSLGFSLVFISLGATATFIGSFLLQNSFITKFENLIHWIWSYNYFFWYVFIRTY